MLYTNSADSPTLFGSWLEYVSDSEQFPLLSALLELAPIPPDRLAEFPLIVVDPMETFADPLT